MSPETVIDRVQCFLKWNAYRCAALDEVHEAIECPAYYTRRRGDSIEYWITAATWRETVFPDDLDAEVPRILCDAGMLRTKGNDGLQICEKIRGKATKVYALQAAIADWKPERRYGRNGNGLAKGCGAPNIAANFSGLSPEEKQSFLLSSAMYLQARLLNSGIALEAQDARAIAQLASVAQGIVRTSVELEQLRTERRDTKREETIRMLINKIPERDNGPAFIPAPYKRDQA